MAGDTLYPRFAEERVTEVLADSPVVLIRGPRQCGKTTLAQMVCPSENLAGGRRLSGIFPDRPADYTYFSFDDEVARVGAEADPLGFVAELPDRVVLDEAHRVSALFAQILQALIELAEAGSEERSILEALSNHVKARDHVIPTRRGRFALD